MSEASDHIIGIDLGTTNSVAAAFDPGTRGARVIKDAQGFAVQPSVVAFHPNGDVLVGAEAKQRRIIDPQNTVYSAKRLIGRTFDSQEVQSAVSRMPFKIKEGHNKQPIITTRAGEFAIPEISAIVLDHMRRLAEGQLGGAVGRAVVTVPANFTDAQRSATATAGAIAGITVVRVLNEPTAAALAYGHQRGLDEIIAVYDFGGGTFDVSILKLNGAIFEVLATAGDSFLGGDDIDERLVEHMCQVFLQKERLDLTHNEIAMQRLRSVAEQVKIELSRRRHAVVKVDEIAYGAGGHPLDLELEVSRDQLLQKISDIIEATFPICGEAVRMAGLSPQQINDVILVGGTTKMPYVRERVSQFFGRMPRTDVSPDEAVACGAALQAMSLERILNRRPTTQGERSTARGYAAARPEPVAPTERRATRGQFIDSMPGVAPGEQLARITRPSAAAPPPTPPARRNTLMGATPAPVPRAGPNQPTIAPTEGMGFDEVSTNIETAVREPFDDDEQPTRPGEPLVAEPSQITAIDLPAPLAVPEGSGLRRPRKPAEEVVRIPDPGPASAESAMPAIVDITPHSLGIGTIAGFCEGIIARNSKVPAQTKKVFSTSRDAQQTVRIRVCQGESRRLAENVVLGDLVLEGLEPRPRGQTKIEVTFHIDHDGILQVRARDATTGQEQSASLDLAGAQSADEIAAAQARFSQLRH